MKEMEDLSLELDEAPVRGSRLLTIMQIFLLSGILLTLMLATAMVFDYLGILPLRERLPGWVKNRPWMKEYIIDANLLQATDVEKIKTYRHELEVRYEQLQADVKKRELLLELRSEKLDSREQVLRDFEAKFNTEYEVMLSVLDSREVQLIAREEAVGIREKQRQDRKAEYDRSIETMARVYEKMEPRIAADAIARLDVEDARKIILSLAPNKSAKILNFVPADVLQQLTPKKTSEPVKTP